MLQINLTVEDYKTTLGEPMTISFTLATPAELLSQADLYTAHLPNLIQH